MSQGDNQIPDGRPEDPSNNLQALIPKNQRIFGYLLRNFHEGAYDSTGITLQDIQNSWYNIAMRSHGEVVMYSLRPEEVADIVSQENAIDFTVKKISDWLKEGRTYVGAIIWLITINNSLIDEDTRRLDSTIGEYNRLIDEVGTIPNAQKPEKPPRLNISGLIGEILERIKIELENESHEIKKQFNQFVVETLVVFGQCFDYQKECKSKSGLQFQLS